MDKIGDSSSVISVNGTQINNLRFADNIDLMDEEQEQFQKNAQIFRRKELSLD